MQQQQQLLQHHCHRWLRWHHFIDIAKKRHIDVVLFLLFALLSALLAAEYLPTYFYLHSCIYLHIYKCRHIYYFYFSSFFSIFCFLRFFYIVGSLLLPFLLPHPLSLWGSCLTITIVVAAFNRNAEACQKVLTSQSSFVRVDALVRLTMTTLANKKK